VPADEVSAVRVAGVVLERACLVFNVQGVEQDNVRPGHVECEQRGVRIAVRLQPPMDLRSAEQQE
jgi:hypothetical protein